MLVRVKEELRDKTHSHDSNSVTLRETAARLVETEDRLQKSEMRLNGVVPKLEGAEAELRLLRRKCDDLENVEEENAGLRGEVNQLRPVWARLEAVRNELSR